MINKDKIQIGDRVEIVELCNDEPNYSPGDKGTVTMIDDLGLIHVNWDNGGSIALLKQDKFKIEPKPMKGYFIVLEGGEGSGKSTLCRYLNDKLTEKGFKVLSTREPGGTSVGEEIRDFILNHPNISPSTETALFLAARMEHIRKIQDFLLSGTEINPAIVICDRYIYSNMVYQGYTADEISGEKKALDIYKLNKSMGAIAPDLVFFLDCPPEIGLQRIQKNNRETNRFDEKDLKFHNKVNEGYKKIAGIISEESVILDVSSDEIQEVSNLALNKVLDLINFNK